MKKIYLLFFLLFSCIISQGQNIHEQFENIKQLIKEADPKANIDDKLILVSFWSPNNNESRELNKEINRVSNIYKNAKLKGGKNGVYFFNYCIEENIMNYKLALKRDSLDNKASYIQNETSKPLVNNFALTQVPYTILFDSNGNVVQENTKKEDVFKLMSKQITR